MFSTLRNHPLRTLLRIIAIIVIGVLWVFAPPVVAFIWTLFPVWALWGLDSRMIGSGAIALLVLIPITLSIPEWEWVSEQLSVYVFFLLCITVGLHMFEMWSASKGGAVSSTRTAQEPRPTVATASRVHALVNEPQRSAPRQPAVHQTILPKQQRTTRLHTSPHLLDLRPQSRRLHT